MALSEIIESLRSSRREMTRSYRIPGLWVDYNSVEPVEVDPYTFFHDRLSEILWSEPQSLVNGTGGGEWSRNAIIYNLFPRATAAFDHDGDGHLAVDGNADGWRETGTLLKAIALLPYIRMMGFNTIHLLPIQTIGQDGRKGSLGSPYAVRNLYALDQNLTEPALDLSVDTLFAGFVEAAHRLGMRVTLEFVLRITARDSDWIAEHPDWFYWIRADVPDRVRTSGTGLLSGYGNPVFPAESLYILKAKVANNDFRELPPPPPTYRAMFVKPPRPDQVKLENGRYMATLDDGTQARIPGAFADWPPDDNQPPWGDVTYLRMYQHPDFNYIAYNTIRMYDERLAQSENRNQGLWEAIAGVIPHYQREYGIDGVLIDMGHALPLQLKQLIIWLAREINPDFAFWDENFSISPQSRDEGYNAVMGYWVLSAHEARSLKNNVSGMANYQFPISFFGAPENHNTPRAAARPNGRSYAHFALSVAITLPAIPYITTGFELCETRPINTGLGFSNEEIGRYPALELPLFSAVAFDWTRRDNMVESVKYAISLRTRYEWLFNDPDPKTFSIGYSANQHIFLYSRKKNGTWINVIANMDQFAEQRGHIMIESQTLAMPGLWGTYGSNMDMFQELTANVSLSPGYVLIVDCSSAPRPHAIFPKATHGETY
jgi:glycosidase